MLPVFDPTEELIPLRFNGHPPLGVNATKQMNRPVRFGMFSSFNGHPPLGVNATGEVNVSAVRRLLCFNGHPPLGVNATV